MTAELREYLLARIDEEEALAHQAQTAAGRRPWEVDGWRIAVDGTAIVEAVDATPDVLPHIVRHDPAFVLLELDARRQVVEKISDTAWTGSYAVRDVVLRLLALPYSGRPDFDPAWRP